MVELKSRYDIYIPIFSRVNDKRVRLFIHLMQDFVNRKTNRTNLSKYVSDDVCFPFDNDTCYTHLRDIPLYMQNQYFKNRDTHPDAGNETLHPEWLVFFGYIAHKLGDLKFNKGTHSEFFNAISKLVNATVNTTENLVCAILDKIAFFNIHGDSTKYSFVENNNLLQNIKSVTFYNSETIYGKLRGCEPFENKINIVEDILGLELNSISSMSPASLVSELKSSIKSMFRTNLNSNIDSISFSGQYGSYKDGSSSIESLVYKSLGVNGLFKDSFNKNEFSYKLDKYFISNMIDDYVSAQDQYDNTDFFDNDESLSYDNKYFRKNGALYTMENGSEVQVDIKSDKFQNLTIDNKCFGTGFQSDGKYECADYLRECLNGNNIDKCIIFLKNSKFWDNAVHEVANMLPPIALETLKAFEFGFEYYHEQTTNQKLVKVNNVSQWLQKLEGYVKSKPQKLTNDQYIAIAGNTKLIGYLQMIVNKINSNPSILNPSYINTNRSSVNVPNYSYLSKMGINGFIPRNLYDTITTEITKFAEQVQHHNITIKKYLIPIIGNRNGIIGNIAVGNPFPFVIHGGSSIHAILNDKISNVYKQTWATLLQFYTSALRRLSVHGKNIGPNNDKKIRELIESLKRSEQKLYKAFLIIEKYLKLIELHGVQDTNSVLSLSTLEKFVDASVNKISNIEKKQGNFFNELKELLNSLDIKKSTPEQPTFNVNHVL